MFGRGRRDRPKVSVTAPDADLVTAVLSREHGPWEVMWVDADLTDEGGFQSLDDLIRHADAAMGSLYAGEARRDTAELQYAIYPWIGNPGDVMLDISGAAGNLVARDIQGTDFEIRAATLDELVALATHQLPYPSIALFRWIKQVASLDGGRPRP